MAYGEPRFTQDMDILLNPTGLRTDLFVRRLTETHYHVDSIAVQRALTGGLFQRHSPSLPYRVDFTLPNEPPLRAMLAERVYLPFDEMRRPPYVTPVVFGHCQTARV